MTSWDALSARRPTLHLVLIASAVVTQESLQPNEQIIEQIRLSDLLISLLGFSAVGVTKYVSSTSVQLRGQ
jgi:hypothetical protein